MWRVPPTPSDLDDGGVFDPRTGEPLESVESDVDHWFQVGRWRVDGERLVVERADREGTLCLRAFRSQREADAIRSEPYLLANDAIRTVLPGVPDLEAADPEMVANGPFVVEHAPPVAGRDTEVGCQLERDWDGIGIHSKTWHRFFRLSGPSGPRPPGWDPDDDIDHWFEVVRWWVEDDALVVERADRPGTIRFRRPRDAAEARSLGVGPPWPPEEP